MGLYAESVWLQFRQFQVAVRAHNLDVLYKSLTHDDLPTDVEQYAVRESPRLLHATRVETVHAVREQDKTCYAAICLVR